MRVRLGKKKYKVYRDVVGGEYDEYGEWIGSTKEELIFRMNIQGGIIYNRMYLKDSGEQSKEAISFRSNQRLYQAIINDDGSSAKEGDIIEYEGALWEVRECRTYNNLRDTMHDEGYAIRLDESVRNRIKQGAYNHGIR